MYLHMYIYTDIYTEISYVREYGVSRVDYHHRNMVCVDFKWQNKVRGGERAANLEE